MSTTSPHDAASQTRNLPSHTPSEKVPSDFNSSDKRPADIDVSTYDIQLLKSLVDEHLFHFQPSPEPSPTDKDKFLRLSDSSAESRPPLITEREASPRNDLVSSFTYLIAANHPPISPQLQAYLADQRKKTSSMSVANSQPDISLTNPSRDTDATPSTATTMAGTPRTGSRTASTTSLRGQVASTKPVKSLNPDPEAQDPSQAEWTPGRTEYSIMLTLACASLLVALDSDILVASLPALAHRLHGTTTQAFWAGSAYLLPYAVVQPFLACLSDIFGRRPLLLLSLAVFLIGSLPCALANDMTTLLAGRIVQGIGGGGIVALTQAIYTDIVPLRQRPKYFGIVLLAWAIGTTIGPVVGGAFTDMSDSGWRWCFWVNFPCGGVALILSAILIRLQPASSPLTLRQKLLTVDCTGGFLLISSLTSTLIALSWGGTTYAWTSTQTLTPLLLGLAGLAAFILYERHWAKYPFIQRRTFPSASAIILFLLAFTYGTTLFMAVYYITFYFSAVRLDSATAAGTHLIPALALALPSSVICGVLMTRLGRWRWAVWLGHALECVGFGLLTRLDDKTRTVEWAVTLCVAGLGSGISLSSINFGVQTTTSSDRDSAGATVMYTFMRSVGMCVGVSIGGTIFQNVAGNALVRRGLERGIAREAEGFVFGTLKYLGEGEEMRIEVVGGFVEGLTAVFICMAVLKGVSLAASLCVKPRTMDRELDGRYKVREKAGE